MVTDASGTVVGEQRYYPYGETRFTSGTIYTDKLFTGQREITGLGIYHYGARFYSPKTGRFLSPDTIIPGYANPQNLNRFSYVRNNPLRYTDPTGHKACGDGEDIDCSSGHNQDPNADPHPDKPHQSHKKGGGDKPVYSPTQSADDCAGNSNGEFSCSVSFTAAQTGKLYEGLDNAVYYLGMGRAILSVASGLLVGAGATILTKNLGVGVAAGVAVAIGGYVTFENNINDLRSLRDTFDTNKSTSVTFNRESSRSPIYINNNNTPIDGIFAVRAIDQILKRQAGFDMSSPPVNQQ